MKPFLPNSTETAPYDNDGFLLKPVAVIEKDLFKRAWGHYRFTHYLGGEPTGNIGNIHILPGKRSAEEFRQGPYIEVVSFSDFQCDPVTGDFGGEIRLAYASNGGNRIPVTGGSISGNIKESQKEFYFSKESQTVNNFCGPETVYLMNANITGAR